MMHILIVYDQTKKDILQELNTIQRTFEDSLSGAMAFGSGSTDGDGSRYY